MLPEVIPERTVKPFKFLFNSSLQDGVHFKNELYYRLKKTPISSRSQLYKLACKLAQHGADVLLTLDDEQCSLWANLRNQKVAASSFLGKMPLPNADTLLENEVSS